MDAIDLIKKAESLDIISLKKLSDSEKILDLLKNVQAIPVSVIDRFWSIYFKIYLSRHGFRKTIIHLEETNEIYGINIANHVSIGSQICKITGNYETQMVYLSKTPALSHAWIEREKIRCMTNLGSLDDATSLIYRLIEYRPTLFNEFAVDFFWRINSWEAMYSLSQKLEMEYFERISGHALRFLNDNNENIFLKVMSIYNSNTMDQIALQKKIFPKSLMNVVSSEGVSINLLPMNIIKKLSGDSSPGILGAALAHLKAIERFLLTGDDFTVITESDSYISKPLSIKNCEAALDRYDFILCTEKQVTDKDKHMPMESINDFIFNGRASGFYGYIINRKTASMILEEYADKKIRHHIDGDIIKWASGHPNLKVGYMSHPAFACAYSSIFSTRAKVELDY